MDTVHRMTKISNSIVTENIINWLYFSIVIFFLHHVNIKMFGGEYETLTHDLLNANQSL